MHMNLELAKDKQNREKIKAWGTGAKFEWAAREKSEGKSVSETHQENAATTGTQKDTKLELPILLQSGIAQLSHLKLLTDVGVNRTFCWIFKCKVP